jgi:hypothetical protein
MPKKPFKLDGRWVQPAKELELHSLVQTRGCIDRNASADNSLGLEAQFGRIDISTRIQPADSFLNWFGHLVGFRSET